MIHGIVHNDERLFDPGKVNHILHINLRAKQDHAADGGAFQKLREIHSGKIAECRDKQVVPVTAALLTGGIHNLRNEAGIAVDKIGVLTVFEKTQIGSGMRARRRVRRSKLIAVFPEQTCNLLSLFLTNAGLAVENERDSRQRHTGGVGDFPHVHPLHPP